MAFAELFGFSLTETMSLPPLRLHQAKAQVDRHIEEMRKHG